MTLFRLQYKAFVNSLNFYFYFIKKGLYSKKKIMHCYFINFVISIFLWGIKLINFWLSHFRIHKSKLNLIEHWTFMFTIVEVQKFLKLVTRDVHGSETFRTVRWPVRNTSIWTCSNLFEQSNSPNSSDSSNSSNYSNKLFTFASIDVPAHPWCVVLICLVRFP